jgi:hypothetical protein
MSDLVLQIRDRATSPAGPTEFGGPHRTLNPPANPECIARAEAVIGHRLPPLLVRLYSEVGNGGFGPDYGLLGIGDGTGADGGDGVAVYRVHRKPREYDPHWSWPAHLLPLVECGCAMNLCVDCSSPEGKIVWFEPNARLPGRPWDNTFIPLSCDLAELMEAWVRGESWIDHFTPLEYRPDI